MQSGTMLVTLAHSSLFCGGGRKGFKKPRSRGVKAPRSVRRPGTGGVRIAHDDGEQGEKRGERAALVAVKVA